MERTHKTDSKRGLRKVPFVLTGLLLIGSVVSACMKEAEPVVIPSRIVSRTEFNREKQRLLVYCRIPTTESISLSKYEDLPCLVVANEVPGGAVLLQGTNEDALNDLVVDTINPKKPIVVTIKRGESNEKSEGVKISQDPALYQVTNATIFYNNYVDSDGLAKQIAATVEAAGAYSEGQDEAEVRSHYEENLDRLNSIEDFEPPIIVTTTREQQSELIPSPDKKGVEAQSLIADRFSVN